MGKYFYQLNIRYHVNNKNYKELKRLYIKKINNPMRYLNRELSKEETQMAEKYF